MRKMTGLHSRIAVLMLLMALLAACGNKNTTASSTTSPSVTYADSVALKGVIPYTWGANTYGQLGNGDTTGGTKLTPMPVAMAGVTGISAGGTHTLALAGGAVSAWGNNGFGQVGDNTNTIQWTPVAVIFPVGTVITAVSAGGNFSLARDSSNSVWAWGDNQFGQLGVDPATLPYRYTAGQVNDPNTSAPLANIAKIAAGGAYSLALITGGAVQSWGLNNVGQLGRITTPSYAPGNVIKVTDGFPLSGVVDLAAGGAHSLFVLSDGTVWACGHNLLGQLGLGGADVTDRTLGVVQVTTFPATAGISLTKYPFQAAAGLDHSLVIISDGTLSSPLKGTVWAWGNNNSVGNGTLLPGAVAVTTPSQVMKGPPPLSPLTDIIKIIAIGDHSLALDSSGQLWAWGDNTFGQLGNNTTTNYNYAIPVTTGADLYHP